MFFFVWWARFVPLIDRRNPQRERRRKVRNLRALQINCTIFICFVFSSSSVPVRVQLKIFSLPIFSSIIIISIMSSVGEIIIAHMWSLLVPKFISSSPSPHQPPLLSHFIYSSNEPKECISDKTERRPDTDNPSVHYCVYPECNHQHWWWQRSRWLLFLSVTSETGLEKLVPKYLSKKPVQIVFRNEPPALFSMLIFTGGCRVK